MPYTINFNDERRRRDELRMHIAGLIAAVREGETPSDETQAWMLRGCGGHTVFELSHAFLAETGEMDEIDMALQNFWPKQQP